MNYKCSLCFFGNEIFFHQSNYSDRKFLVASLTLNQVDEHFWLSPKFIFCHCPKNTMVIAQKNPIVQMMIQFLPLI
jgi:hypothetical protein